MGFAGVRGGRQAVLPVFCLLMGKVREVTGWLGRKDSNLRSRIQSPLPYHLATPHGALLGWYRTLHEYGSRLRRRTPTLRSRQDGARRGRIDQSAAGAGAQPPPQPMHDVPLQIGGQPGLLSTVSVQGASMLPPIFIVSGALGACALNRHSW